MSEICDGNTSLSGFMRVWTLTRKVMCTLRKRKTISGSDRVNQSSEASGFGINRWNAWWFLRGEMWIKEN